MHGSALDRHDMLMNAAAFSPDGQWTALSLRDNTVVLVMSLRESWQEVA